MVVRVHNVTKWQELPSGEVLALVGVERRKIRLELNCPEPTRFDLVWKPPAAQSEDSVFLGVCDGLDVIEFSAPAGECKVVPTSESEVWFFTNEGDQIAVPRPETATFTKVATRRTRNHELELMMHRLEQNMARRLGLQAAEIERELLRRQEAARAAGADPETGEVNERPDESGSETGGDDSPGPGETPAGGEPEAGERHAGRAKGGGAPGGKGGGKASGVSA